MIQRIWAVVFILLLFPMLVSADEEEDKRIKPDVYALHVELRGLLDAGKFVELDRRLTRYDQTLERTASGLSKIEEVFNYLTHCLNSKPNALELLAQWKEQNHGSYISELVHADLLVWASQQARGTGFSNTVSDEAWQSAKSLSDSVLQKLEAISYPNGIKPPLYYKIKLAAIINSSIPNKKKALLETFEEAVEYYPTFYSVYFTIHDKLQTKWFGSESEQLRFIKEQADRANKDIGNELYTRLAWSLSGQGIYVDFVHQRMLGVDYFYQYPEIDWIRMRSGFMDIIARYPSPWNLNQFAWFACVAGDKETARSLLPEVKANPIHDVWGGVVAFNAWVRWVEEADFPLSGGVQGNWSVEKVNGMDVHVSPETPSHTNLVSMQVGQSHFEAVISKEHWQVIHGYEVSNTHEGRGSYYIFPSQGKTYPSAIWWKEHPDTDEETVFRGVFGHGDGKAYGLKTDRENGFYLGGWLSGKRSGVGYIVNRGLLQTSYFGEFRDHQYQGFGVLSGTLKFGRKMFVGHFDHGEPRGVGVVIGPRGVASPKDIEFVKVEKDGSVSSIDHAATGDFDFTNFRYGNNTIAHIGHMENGLPKGMGVRFYVEKGITTVGAWAGMETEGPGWMSFNRIGIWYSINGISSHILYRNGIIYQGIWNAGPSLLAGSIVYPDGRSIYFRPN